MAIERLDTEIHLISLKLLFITMYHTCNGLLQLDNTVFYRFTLKEGLEANIHVAMLFN